MRVLHIDSEKTWRGGENQVRLLVEGLKKKGVESHLIAPPDSAVLQRLSEHARCYGVPMSSGADPVAAYRIGSYCRRHRIDVIDAQSAKAHSLALLSQFFCSHPGLVVHRRVDYLPGANPASRLKYFSRKVDRYVAISQAIGRILLDYGLPQDRVTVVPSAVDPSRFQQIDRLVARRELLECFNLPPDTVLIGNASALTEQKGYEVLLESLARLGRYFDRFHCLIAGDGHLASSLQRQAADLGLGQRLTFLGWIEHVDELLAGLDVLAMPSNYEGLGTLILDGIYAGCCVVATSVGGIPEMIVDGQGGLLSPKGDAQSFAEHLHRVCRSEALRIQFNEFARRHVAERFSLEAMVAGNLQVYHQVLEQRTAETRL